ncbi:PREDICTED: cadherin-related tumor suppressor-like, partial [Priapulus caudatus]|uniref:Cadherin-related tumor suppressor-like n=1 Tax=Priapulus caudatus TaxID=37621 RepID=A0ABM1DPY6_PRICU
MDGRTMYGLIHWRTKMKMFLLFLIVFHGTLVLGESENESVGVNYLSTVTEKVSLRVSENQPSGTFIGRIPVKPGFQYRFNDNPAYFVLNGTTGEITTRVVIDRENLAEDVMNLVVLSSHPTYPIEVKVTIADENDNSPEFPDRMFNIKWSENAAVGTQYILDTASDADKGVNGISTNYEIVSGNTDDKFTLAITASLSGDEVYLYLENLKLLDREVTDNYVLNISARDAGTPARSGHAIVNVTVIDFNDSPPTFDHSEYAVSISENAAAEASVMRVRATDADVGANAEVSYYITDDTEQFAVERDTGIVRTLHDKLRCKKNICVFTVQAKDHGVPYLTGRAYVTVNLIDENDHSPEITFRYIPATSDYATVNENAQDGTIVALISVVDKDEGDNGRCSVAIKEGNELGAFRLEDAFGWSLLKVNKQIDREENSVYNLTILAWDHGEPPRESSENIIIVVNDVNDHTPTFLKLEYVAVLSESVPTGSFVASVSATDADTGINAKLTYSIVSGDSHGWFAIIADSGLITTARRLDRESSAMMTLNVSVNDGGPSPHISYAKVTVQILDENDETPAFTESVYNVSVSESLPPGSAVAAATAIDNDDGPNGTVVYAFDSDVEMKYPGTFLLDSATGKISTRVLLDREKRDFYSLGVIARDDGRPPLSSSAAVHVTVTDINDNSPIFYPTHYFASVLENLPAGTIVTKVDAYDLDAGSNGRVHYEITGGADGKFQIDPDSGAIKTSASLDREVTPVFKLTLRARDAGGRESAELAIVEIKVSDVHDTPPAFSRRRGYGFSIVEDGERPDVGRFVGAVEATSTLSRATVSYAIASGDHRGMFRVDASSGAISTAKPIDREQESVYHLIVVASDGSVPAKTNVTVTVLDVNDNAPYFASQSVDVHVYENWPVGHEVYVVDARDDDEGGNSRITYELEDNPGGMFRMNAVTGAVFLNKPVASSAREIYHAKVRASDNGVPRLSSSLRVAVHVHDVNDHTPRFTRPAYATSVRESAPLNHRFITVDARDDDTGPDGVVSYAITGGNADGKFGVFPDGFLYVQSGLDRETRDRYELTVTATDHGLQPRSSTARVVVHVADDNDNAPAFGNATYALRIGENLPPDTLVGVVSATDADLGRNGEVSYAMATRQGDFAVDALTGEIRTLRDFDREVLVELTGDDFFTVEVSAYDNGVPRLRSHATVVVYVVDANDNAPAFDQDVYEISVSESAPVGAPLLRVSAADADAGANGDVVYDVVGGNEERAFAIDSGSGKVRLARLLDRETASRYELVVRAQDGGEDVHLSTTALVVVIVQDANDNAPTFFEQTYGARVSEAALVGKSVGRVDAVDDDEGDNAVVTYAIVAGNQYETFGIDGRTGEVFLAKRLDYEQLSTYTLNVSAADHGVPALTSSVAFVVDVEDFNDNAPVFSSGPAVRQILEGIPINSAVFTVSATDRDSENNGRVEYSIVKQEPKGAHFRIDAQTGTIYTNGEIDHEQQAMFKLIVRASDMADAPADRLAATKLVTILVEDVNDNEPKFVSMDAAVVPSTAPSNHLVTKVAAEDADDDDFGEVFYEIVDGDRDVFQLDGSTGYLYTRSPLAVDVATYSLSVRASD